MGGTWTGLMRESLVRPRAAARELLALNLGREVLIEAALGVSAAGIVLAWLATRVAGGEVDPVSAALLGHPLLGAAIQLAVMLVIGWLTWGVGRLFGGAGGFGGALGLVVWLNVMMVVIQSVQLAALFLLPPLAAVLALATVLWALWAYANFVTELHGFGNPFFVLGGVLLTLIVLFFGVGMVFALLAAAPGEGA